MGKATPQLVWSRRVGNMYRFTVEIRCSGQGDWRTLIRHGATAVYGIGCRRVVTAVCLGRAHRGGCFACLIAATHSLCRFAHLLARKHDFRLYEKPQYRERSNDKSTSF